MTEVTAFFSHYFFLISLLLTFSIIVHIVVDITIFCFVHMVTNITILLFLLVLQQAANHRGQVQTHDCLYQMSLSMQSQGFASFSCPTPDQFRAEVAWPEDWPEAQAREAPAGSPGDAEEARMD